MGNEPKVWVRGSYRYRVSRNGRGYVWEQSSDGWRTAYPVDVPDQNDAGHFKRLTFSTREEAEEVLTQWALQRGIRQLSGDLPKLPEYAPYTAPEHPGKSCPRHTAGTRCCDVNGGFCCHDGHGIAAYTRDFMPWPWVHDPILPGTWRMEPCAECEFEGETT